jgi:hypothetical protein
MKATELREKSVEELNTELLTVATDSILDDDLILDAQE